MSSLKFMLELRLGQGFHDRLSESHLIELLSILLGLLNHEIVSGLEFLALGTVNTVDLPAFEELGFLILSVEGLFGEVVLEKFSYELTGYEVLWWRSHCLEVRRMIVFYFFCF